MAVSGRGGPPCARRGPVSRTEVDTGHGRALDGIEAIEAAAHEVLADDTARWIKSQLSADLEAMYADVKK
jgi:hypothetical protein